MDERIPALADAHRPTPTASRGRALAWVAVVAAAAAVVVWFVLPRGDAGPTGPPARGARAIPVSAAPVEHGPLVERAVWPGELSADAADITSLVVGRLAEVRVRVGDAVAKGDVLAEVDTVELSAQLEAARATTAAAGAAARRARVDLTAARRELARANELAKKGIIAEQEVEARRSAVDAAVAAVRVAEAQGVEADANADVLERRVAESTIKAPFAGVVAQRSVDPGAYVSVGSPVVRLVARAPLRVSFEVASEAVEELRAAGGVDVRSATTGERQFHARLTGVAGEVRRERRVVAAEGVVEDPPPAWLPGMFCEVLLAKRSVSDAPLVASSALVTRADAETGDMRTGVFVADGDSARWVPAAVLARDGDRLALDAGGALPEGARVLVSGHTDLADGAPIKLTADVFADDGGDGAAPREASP